MILQTSKEVTEGVVRRCSVKKVFLEILQNSQGSTCARVFFYNKVAGFRPETLLKKILWRRCFLVKFAKFLENLFYRTPLKMFDSSKNRYVEEQMVTG